MSRWHMAPIILIGTLGSPADFPHSRGVVDEIQCVLLRGFGSGLLSRCLSVSTIKVVELLTQENSNH